MFWISIHRTLCFLHAVNALRFIPGIHCFILNFLIFLTNKRELSYLKQNKTNNQFWDVLTSKVFHAFHAYHAVGVTWGHNIYRREMNWNTQLIGLYLRVYMIKLTFGLINEFHKGVQDVANTQTFTYFHPMICTYGKSWCKDR